MRRGDLATDVVLFLTLIIVGIILSVWYLQSLSPTRLEIGTVSDDLQELKQHITNACGVSIYRASYVPMTPAAQIITNSSHLCILAKSFGSCRALPCDVAPADITVGELQAIRIQKENGTLSLRS